MERERKRKLPARAAARNEQFAKKRNASPQEEEEQESPPTPPAPEPVEEALEPLPTSLQPGKALPTVEEPQGDDLSSKEYQSVTESGVLSESLTRSRQKWIVEGLFEKYWSRPKKSKGVVSEEPKNPSKDTMVKLGAVTITVEPHLFDAVMFGVKDPKPPPPTHSSAVFRPIMQYGPPNGSVPPPAPVSKASTPAPSASWNAPAASNASAARPPADPVQKPSPTPSGPSIPPTVQPGGSGGGHPPVGRPPAGPTPPNSNPNTTPTPAPAKPAQSNDPTILRLAERAAGDPHLKEIMKKVASATASPDELAEFQKVIDQISLENKAKSPESLVVEGKTVRYYAEEVRNILDIVLRSNPQQKSFDLKAPQRSNPLIVELVKLGLDNERVASMIRRIADKCMRPTDAVELKSVLDGLYRTLNSQQQLAPPPVASPVEQMPSNGVANGVANGQQHAASQPPRPQQLISKAPLPAGRSDLTAVVFEFSANSGDRFLFPKFSILEYDAAGQQVIASFLIVMKGGSSETLPDPEHDYYQPVTIRIQGRHLENLARVVVPRDEAQRYMDGVMDTMKRAEFMSLALRLPRGNVDREADRDMHEAREDESSTSGSTPQPAASFPGLRPQNASVMWASTKPAQSTEPPRKQVGHRDTEQISYRKLVNAVASRDPEVA